MDLSAALRSRGPNAGTPTDGSRTMTRDPTEEHPDSDENEEQGPGGQVVGTLHIRGACRANNRLRVAWNKDVIDNEGCGKKKSKSCAPAQPAEPGSTLPAPGALHTTTPTTTARTTTIPVTTQTQAFSSTDRMEDLAWCIRSGDPLNRSRMRMRSSQRENDQHKDG
ncbi:hypothetical protein D9613_012431 [Agrocybe pediades]|uniref:Uncharacterized protein n=1 Tax=Agrocybe pediades TaxID=84607 RepID=A0A8H4QS23_9AGAR|nr:hypothetical protein D9613_012431 [Agrocybe pediades]